MKKTLYREAPFFFYDYENSTVEEVVGLTGHNTGNLIFAYAMNQHLTNVDTELKILSTPVKEIKDKCDQIIITAANIINSEIDLSEYVNLIKEIDVPITLVGIGIQSNGGQIILKKGTYQFLQEVSKRSHSIGVRGYDTYRVLKKIGIKNVYVMGCSSLFLHGSKGLEIKKNNIKKTDNIAVNATYYAKNSYVKTRLSHMMEIGIKNDYDFIAQDEISAIKLSLNQKIDSEKCKFELDSYDNSGKSYNMLKKYFKRKTLYFYDVEKWLGHMRSYDMIIGTRFHGNVAGILAGIPALFITVDRRTEELVRFFRLPHISLKKFENDRLAVDDLVKKVDYMQFNSMYPSLYNNYVRFLNLNKIAHNLETVEEKMYYKIIFKLYNIYLMAMTVKNSIKIKVL